MNLFISASIYQLFNAINITTQNNMSDNTDIILLSMKKNYVESIDISCLKKFFNNVYVIKFEIFNNKIAKLGYCLKIIFIDSNHKMNQKYDKVFLSGTEIYSKIVAEKCIKKNGAFFYYEDGLASYYSVLNPDTKKRNDFLLKIRYGHRNLDFCKGLYVYEPQCVTLNPKEIPCFKIKKIERNEINIERISKVFKDAPFKIKTKYVFLEAWFDNQEQLDFQKELCKVLIDKVGNENISIKAHPNQLHSVERLEEVEYIDSLCCFELSNFYENWDDVIFVSAVSTASVSPKLVYGDSPKIIFLYRLFQQKFGMWKGIDKSIDNLKQLYSENKHAIYTPNTIDEFISLLNV